MSDKKLGTLFLRKERKKTLRQPSADLCHIPNHLLSNPYLFPAADLARITESPCLLSAWTLLNSHYLLLQCLNQIIAHSQATFPVLFYASDSWGNPWLSSPALVLLPRASLSGAEPFRALLPVRKASHPMALITVGQVYTCSSKLSSAL